MASSSSFSTPIIQQDCNTQSHASLVLQDWKKLQSFTKAGEGKADIVLDGNSLDIAQVTAAARFATYRFLTRTRMLTVCCGYRTSASVTGSQDIVDGIDRSVKFLQDNLAKSHSLYGITTGFGGSADTRTNAIGPLQVALLQHQQCGILPVPIGTIQARDIYQSSLSEQIQLASLSMPESWVRSAMLVRANSLIRGHSAVRLVVIQTLLTLLQHDCIPLVPLRGSISASGDLSPLSYVAGLLEGNPDILVWTGGHGQRQLMPADQALSQLELPPVVFAAKEGLGVLNGTAFSTGVATLALQEANIIAVLSQILTAMAVEALTGDIASFDPFIARVRPHSGQLEAAKNISSFLGDSKLIRQEGRDGDGELRQDRYALRTSSQWLGPQLEDLHLAHKQIMVELNSTTDNPLVDVDAGKFHHGGNFQAASITSSTEKTRSCLQMIGKMVFAQSTELLDVSKNNGLPPNLAVDDPSTSYTFKGVDIHMAAYMSELAFIASPVSSHVQSAEMGNQNINSMALVSARYTYTAVDIVSLMCSAHLYSLCHALDLRAMQASFFEALKPALETITCKTMTDILDEEKLKTLTERLWKAIFKAFTATRTEDSRQRFIAMAKMCQPILLEALDGIQDLDNVSNTSVNPLKLIQDWSAFTATKARDLFNQTRSDYLTNPDAKPLLGLASKKMYTFVRDELKVPMHRGLVDHPVGGGQNARTIGSQISIIYHALRLGRLMTPVMECLEEFLKER